MPNIETVMVSAYTIPTDGLESDGTVEWDSTTLVLVEIAADGKTGLGYGYADTATARLIHDKLAGVVSGLDAMDIPRAGQAMIRAVRNLGRCGIASMAISAVDNALWDLKARLLEVALVDLFGSVRDALPVYGSGGFTSYSDNRLAEQLGGWVAGGISRVKMKVGREPERDLERVRVAREAIGEDTELFVDANSAYSRKEALFYLGLFAAACDVRWMEQPLAPEDLKGLRLLRDRAPAHLDIADGEYGYEPPDFRAFLEAGAVDVLMADATRCGGQSGFLAAGHLCESFNRPLSAHCAPSIHAHIGCAIPAIRHGEYFHDHARVEHMLFDGALTPVDGVLHPDRSRPGFGLEFRRADAEPYLVCL